MRDNPATEGAFERFSRALIGLPVSHVWRGYGSAIFLECGPLRDTTRLDGSPGNPFGKMSVMIEWSWRIEGKRSILCGSWSDEAEWPRAFARLIGTNVVGVSLLGRLKEIDLELSNGIHVVSFLTAKGHPAWALIDHEAASNLHVRGGRLCVEAAARPEGTALPKPSNP